MINSVSRRHSSGQFCFAGSRPAMTMLALASPRIAISFNLRRLTPVLPIAIGRPNLPPHRPLPKEALNARQLHTAAAEIPIVSDAPPLHTSRGFLPWRFAYAGPRVRAAPPSWGRHPQTFTQGGSRRSFPIISSPRASTCMCIVIPAARLAAGIPLRIAQDLRHAAKGPARI